MNIVVFIGLLCVVFFVVFWCATPVMVAKEARAAQKSGDVDKLIAALILGAIMLYIVGKNL